VPDAEGKGRRAADPRRTCALGAARSFCPRREGPGAPARVSRARPARKFARLYTPEHLEEFDYLRDAGFPGEYPSPAASSPPCTAARYWTMRQYGRLRRRERVEKRYRYLLENGQTGLSVAFDLPTQMGYDSDSRLPSGRSGRSGLRSTPSRTWRSSSTDPPRESLHVDDDQFHRGGSSWRCTSPWGTAGGAAKDLNGTIQNDILKEYIARGTYIFPPAPSMRLSTDIFAYCKDRIPRWNTISISGYHIREAGSTAAQEVAFTLANGIAYVQAPSTRG